MYKILIIGSGGREHSIARALSRSKYTIEIYGIGLWANPGFNQFDIIDINNPVKVLDYAQTKHIDIAIIGSENQLAQGLADKLKMIGIWVFGPTEYNSRLETDKIWARQHINNLYNPRYQVVYEDEYELSLLYSIMDKFNNQFVVKAVGLRGGKGVRTNFESIIDIDQYCKKLLKEDGILLIEEKLTGTEFNLLSFADGRNLSHMPPAKDYKKSDNGDLGLNTGGRLGCITYPSFLNRKDIETAQYINEEVYTKLHNYVGVIYGRFMKTDDGIRVIDYNCRFGDPVGINLLESLETDFMDIITAMITGTLDKIDIHWFPRATVTTYLTDENYPSYVKLPFSKNLIYGKIIKEGDKYKQLGSRAVAVYTEHRTLSGAIARNNELLSLFDNTLYYRTDIKN